MIKQVDGLSPREIVDTFPEEAKEIAPRELKRWKNALRTYICENINPLLKKVSSKNRPVVQKLLIARWPHWEVIQTLSQRIKQLERIINVLEIYTGETVYPGDTLNIVDD